MKMRVNQFKRGLHEGQTQIGFWCSMASNVAVELLAGSGFDWLLLDTEHSPNDLSQVYTQLQACMENDVEPIVRPPWNDMVVIKRLLDAGVQTLLVPMVQNAQEAAAAVAACRYPPNGVRGFASTSRSSRFGRIENYHLECEKEICVLVQIETAVALSNLEEIAAVPGIDGIFIGPGDLSASLGYLGDPSNDRFQPVLEQAIERIRKAGCAPGILTANRSLAHRYLELGCLFVAVGSDSGLLARGSEQLAQEFSQHKGTEGGLK